MVQAAAIAGASRIFVIDTNSQKFEKARELGATDFVNPRELSVPVQQHLVEQTKWGVDVCLEATGDVDVMRAAIESAHRGWGQTVLAGVAAAGKEVSTRPFQFITGRKLTGTAFGGWKSRAEVPQLMQRVVDGELDVSKYVTHRFDGVEGTLDALKAMETGDCIRAVVKY